MAHLTTLEADSQVSEVTSELELPSEQLGETVFQVDLLSFPSFPSFSVSLFFLNSAHKHT